MNYRGTLIAVKNLSRSREFYCKIFGLKVTNDFGDNIMLSDNIFLQTLESWQNFIESLESGIHFGHNSSELYFEEADIDNFVEKLKAYPDIRYVHPIKEHSWGQRVIRFYDPDSHIIEVGEDMSTVVRRFSQRGMSAEKIALRMNVPLSYVLERLPGI